jgi:D-amino-acid dehydrogenase
LTKHILVVGGGVIGLSTAYHALGRGHRVTVLEREGPDGNGCSFGNAGMVVPSHFVPLAAPGAISLALRFLGRRDSPFGVKPRLSLDLLRWGLRFARSATRAHVARAAPILRDLHLAGRRGYEELAQGESGAVFGLEKNGLLMLCKTAHGLAEEAATAELARTLGVPAQVLSPDEAAALEPGVRLDVAGAVYFPLDCHLDPGRLMGALRRRVTERGGDLAWGTTVTGWRVRGDRVDAVATNRGEVSADEYVLAAGAWSSAMAHDLGVRLPLQAGKGYSLTLEHPRRQPRICSILTEARVAVTPMGGALRFGGTLELTGLDLGVERARVRGIVRSIPQYLPDFSREDFDDVPVWSGLRPCSPDGLPYVGRFARYQNLSAATGHSMMGVSLAPVTGRLLAEILAGETPSLDVRALNPDRFA